MDNEITNEVLINQAISFSDFGLRFLINLVAIAIIVRFIYYPNHKNKDFLFTFFIFNVIIFLLCYLLGTAQIKLGFAFGLFAIFSIIRYRTVTIPVREMGYFFLSVALAIVNALTNVPNFLWILLMVNLAFMILVYILDSRVNLSHENYKEIIYDNIQLIHPDKRGDLLADLKQKTGLAIHRVEISKIDYFKETAQLNAYYYSADNESNHFVSREDNG